MIEVQVEVEIGQDGRPTSESLASVLEHLQGKNQEPHLARRYRIEGRDHTLGSASAGFKEPGASVDLTNVSVERLHCTMTNQVFKVRRIDNGYCVVLRVYGIVDLFSREQEVGVLEEGGDRIWPGFTGSTTIHPGALHGGPCRD